MLKVGHEIGIQNKNLVCRKCSWAGFWYLIPRNTPRSYCREEKPFWLQLRPGFSSRRATAIQLNDIEPSVKIIS
jgi:hypothetical protein